MKSARVVDPPSEYAGAPCDWALRSEPDSDRWLKLHRYEVAYLGQAAVSLAALRYLPHNRDAYFGGHDRWRQLAGVSESTLQRHVKILIEKGYIVPDGRQGPRVHRYLLSRAEPKTDDDNDAFSVMPIGFLGRVPNFSERVVFSIVISSFRRAVGIIKKCIPVWKLTTKKSYFSLISHYGTPIFTHHRDVATCLESLQQT